MNSRIIFLLLICLSSCTGNPNQTLIIGNWSGTEWLVEGQPSTNNAMQTSFTFDSAGNYSYVYAGNKENGTYKVANDELYTTPLNEAEMMVKIVKLTADSLVLGMNRGGKAEQLILMRQR